VSGERFGRDMRRVVKAHEQLERLYADRRFAGQRRGSDLRSLLAHLIWAITVEQLSGDNLTDRLLHLMPGTPSRPWGTIDDAIREDCPRYEPPADRGHGYYGLCSGTMVRRSGPCGQQTASMHQRRTDPVTGQWETVVFCRRHEAEGREAWAIERQLQESGTLPEPLPNTGGLAPSHSRANWANLYARVSRNWKAPAVGIIAADWPTMAKVHAARPSFVMLDGDGQETGTDGPATERPRFEVVR